MQLTFGRTAAIVAATLAAPLSLGAQRSTIRFPMIHSQRVDLMRGTESIGFFTPAGPIRETMRPSPRERLSSVTFDSIHKTWYGQYNSDLGTIDARGKFTKVNRPKSVDTSNGPLAFDTKRGCVLLVSLSGGARLWEYFPRGGGRWNRVAKLQGHFLHGLAHDPRENLLYTLEAPRGREITTLRVFNRHGAALESKELSTPIPFVSSRGSMLQLAFAGGKLWAQTSHYEHPRLPNEIRSIDVDSGQVALSPYNEKARTNIKTWPEWTGGPSASRPLADAGAQGRGHFSTYITPEKLVAKNASDLHIVTCGRPEVTAEDWLQRLKKVGVSSKKGRVSISIDFESKDKLSGVVEVVVKRTKKPISLALVSGARLAWSIRLERGALVDRVWLFEHEYFKGSQITGIDPKKVTRGAPVRTASAWETTASSGLAFDKMIETIRASTRMRETSFQGLSYGESFVVPLMRRAKARPGR